MTQFTVYDQISGKENLYIQRMSGERGVLQVENY